MGIRQPSLAVLERVRKYLGSTKPERKPYRMLSISWQDCVVTNEELIATIGFDCSDIPDHPDWHNILGWHKCQYPGYRIPDWVELLRRMEFDPVVTDLVRARGCEQYLDLNNPFPRELIDSFDFVLDNCSQHCANIGQAMTSIASAVKVGGLVMHLTPMMAPNQGFYSISPCLYHDFYSQNGFLVLEHCGYYSGPDGPTDYRPLYIDPVNRMKDVPGDAVQMFVAVKEKNRDLVWPTQGKFIKNPHSLRNEVPD